MPYKSDLKSKDRSSNELVESQVITKLKELDVWIICFLKKSQTYNKNYTKLSSF